MPTDQEFVQSMLQDYKSMGDEQDTDKTAQELNTEYRQEVDDVLSEEPSLTRRIEAGFHSTDGIMLNLLRAQESKNPELAESIYNFLPGFEGKEDLDQYYGQGFTNPYLPDSVRRQAVNQKKQDTYNRLFSDVPQEGFFYGVGQMGGAMWDPTSLIPGVGVAKMGAVGAGAVYGALWAGGDAAARSYADEGAVDAVNTAIATAIGGAAGAALEKFIVGPLSQALSSKIRAGSKATAAELEGIALKAVKGTEYETVLGKMDFSRMANEVNENILNRTPEESLSISNIETSTGYGFNPFDANIADYKIGKIERFEGGELQDPVRDPLSVFQQSLKDQVREYKEVQKALRKAPSGSQKVYDQYLLKKYKEAFPEPKNEAMAKAFQKAIGGDLNKFHEELAYRQAAMDDYIDSGLRDWVAESQAGIQIQSDAAKIIDPSTGYPKYSAPVEQVQVGGPPSMGRAQPEIELSSRDLRHIIGTGEVPYYSKTGDILSPKIGMQTKPLLASLEDIPEATEMQSGVMSFLSGRWFTKPRKVMEAHGPAGKVLSDSMQIAEYNKLQRIGGTIVDMKRVLGQAGIKGGSREAEMVSDVVRKVLKEEEVPQNIRDVANHVRRFYSKTLKELKDAKVIDQETFNTLQTRAKEKGYMTRVYDEEFLSTKEGREQFASALAEVKFSNDTGIETSLKSILGEKSSHIKDILKDAKFSEDGIHRVLPASAWKKVAILRRKAEPSRSKYIDKERKIPEEFERALSPFLVRDPEVILSKYAEDTFTRLEYAKVFGANDEYAKALIEKISKVAPKENMKVITNTYYDSVRDPLSENIQSFINVPEKRQALLNSARSFQVLRLGTASILNIGQPIVNGSIYLTSSKAIGTPQALQSSLKGIINGYRSIFGNKALKEEAMRSGAANQVMIMNHMGQINEAYNRVVPKKFAGGTWNPLNVLNNPQEFLRVSGFFKAEEIARSVGYFQGKAYIESLMSKKAKLLARGNRASPKKLAEVNRALLELGIEDLPVEQITAGMVERGGQIFSNKINFLNSPLEIPLGWNSFYGRVTRQFQSYAFHQGSFVLDHVIKPARQGNFAPAFTLMGMAMGVGYPLDSLRRFIMQDDREFTGLEKFFRGFMSIGALGIVMDTLDRATWGPEALLGVISGPTAQDVSAMTFGVGKDIKRSFAEGEVTTSTTQSQLRSVIPYARAFSRETKKGREEIQNQFGNQFNEL